MGGADDGLMEIWEEEGEGIQVAGGGEKGWRRKREGKSEEGMKLVK